jgi:hypothetical protein
MASNDELTLPPGVDPAHPLADYFRKVKREQARSDAAVKACRDPELAAQFRANAHGISMSYDAFHAEEHRQTRARAAFHVGRIRERSQSRRPARKPDRRESVSARAPRRQRRTRTAASRDGPPSRPSGDDDDPHDRPRPEDLAELRRSPGGSR